MKVFYCNKNGFAVPSGQVVQTDSCRDSFTIEIDSMNGITKNRLKDILQEKGGIKVRLVRHEERIVVVR
jgi:hypothetical protein